MQADGGGSTRFNWRLAVVLVLAIAVLGGTLHGLRKWRRLYMATQAYESGVKAYETRDWRKAVDSLGSYCIVHPTDIDALLKYADAHLRIVPQKEGNIRQAVAAYRQILREEPTHEQASNRVADIYLQIGMPGEAEMVARRRLAAGDDPRARELLAGALGGQRKFKEAAEELRRIIDTHPERVAPYSLLAQLMRERPADVPGSPLEVLKSCAQRNPRSAEAHMALGAYLVKHGGSDDLRREARAALETACALGPGDVAGRVRLASYLMDGGDMDAAREELRRAVADDPSFAMAWIAWAELLKIDGSPDEARETAARGLESLGGDAYPFLAEAAELYIMAGDLDAASRCIGQVETLQPLSSDIPMVRGLLAQKHGKLREAVAIWRKAVGEGLATPRMRLALAGAYETLLDWQSAVRELRAFISNSPGTASAHVMLARALSRTGAWSDAGQQATLATRLAPGSMDALAADIEIRAQMAARRRDAGQASAQVMRDAEALLAKYPDDNRMRMAAAQAAQLAGDTARVRELLPALALDESTRFMAGAMEAGLLWNEGMRDESIACMKALIEACDAAPDRVEQYAELLLRAGNPEEALAAARRAAESAPQGMAIDYRLALARIESRAGDEGAARRTLTQVAEAEPRDVASRLMLLGMLEQDQWQDAQRLVDEIKAVEGDVSPRWRYWQARAWLMSPEWTSLQSGIATLLSDNIRDDPYDVGSQLLLGVAQEKAGNVRLAIETYRRAYERDRQSAPVVFRLVSALQKSNNLGAAEEVLQEAARAGLGGEALAGLRLGQDLRRGRADLAMDTAQEMLDRDPDNAGLRVFMAKMKLSAGDLDGAGALLEGLEKSDPAVTMAKADVLLRRNLPQEATAVCDALVESSDSALARLVRARVRAAAGAPDAAEEDYRAATRMEPGAPQNWVALSDFLAAGGDAPGALDAAWRALGADESDPQAAMRVYQLSRGSDPAARLKARETLDRAVSAHPQDAELMLFTGQTLMSENNPGSLEKARKMFEGVALRDPGRVDAWLMLARASIAGGLPDAALEAVARGLAADPEAGRRKELLLLKAQAEDMRWPALAAVTLRGLWESDRTDTAVGLMLAAAYRRSGEHSKAVALLQEMRPLAADRDVMAVDIALVHAIDAAGDGEKAVARVLELRDGHPQDPRPVLAAAVVLVRMERAQEAAEAVANWQRDHPEDVATALAAAKVFMDAASGTQGEAAGKARDAARAVLEKTAADHPSDVRPRLALAVAHQASGAADKAEDLYRQVLSLEGENPVAINNLAWILCEDRSRPEEALALADVGRKRFPEIVDLIDTRGIIYQRLGRLDDARRELEECLNLAPKNSAPEAVARFHLARILAQQNRKAEAAAIIRELLARQWSASALSSSDKAEAQELLVQIGGSR